MDIYSQIDDSAFVSQHLSNKVDETRRMLYEIRDIQTYKNREYKGVIVQDPNQMILDTILDYCNKGTVEKNGILGIIQNDNNELNSFVVKHLISEGIITEQDLRDIGIQEQFLDMLNRSYEPVIFRKGDKIERINKKSTEIYFWGIPSSGKTCAIGALLSTLSKLGNGRVMKKDNDCQGYDYMTRLSSLFKDQKVMTLPAGTPVSATYEMGFDLYDTSKIYHPITMIDLAGELIRCMYKEDAGMDLNTEEEETLETVTNLLISQSSKNQKIHVFVMEYGAEDRNYEGLPQSDYLDGAMNYIERTGIFKNNTDAIILLVTKADKAGHDVATQQKNIKNYIENNYSNFNDALKHICENNDINNKKLIRLFITLGDVCFQDYCFFNSSHARSVVEQLISQTFTEDISASGLFKKFFGK